MMRAFTWVLLLGCQRELKPLVLPRCDDEVGCLAFNLQRAAVTVDHALVIRLTGDPPELFDWSVEERDAGRFDVPGIFVAPSTPQHVHIVARSLAHPEIFARIALQVVAALDQPIVTVDRSKVSSGVAYLARIVNNAGVDRSRWQIGNGVITTTSSETEVGFVAGEEGFVSLQVTVANLAGDAAPPGGLLVPVVPAATANFEIDVPPDATAGKHRVDVWVKQPIDDFSYEWSVEQAGVTRELEMHGANAYFDIGTEGAVTVRCRAVNSAGDAAAEAVNRTIPLVAPGVYLIAGSLGGVGTRDGSLGENRLFNVHAVEQGPSGSVYLLDGYALRLHEANGTVSTLVGVADTPGQVNGANEQARMSLPTHMALVGDEIYVVDDNWLRRVRHVGSDWVMSPVLQFGLPGCDENLPDKVVGLVGHSGSLFVADEANLFTVAPTGATGVVITHIAGSCAPSGSGRPRFFDIDSVGGVLYAVAGSGAPYHAHVASVDLGTGNLTPLSTEFPIGTSLGLEHLTITDDSHFVYSVGDDLYARAFSAPSGVAIANGFADLSGVARNGTNAIYTVFGGGDIGSDPSSFSLLQSVVYEPDTEGSALVTVLAGLPGEFAADITQPPPRAGDMRFGDFTDWIAVRPSGELYVSHGTDGQGDDDKYAIDLFSSASADASVSLFAISYRDEWLTDGPLKHGGIPAVRAMTADANGRLVFADYDDSAATYAQSVLRVVRDDGYVETLATVTGGVRAVFVDPRDPDDIYVTTATTAEYDAERRLYRYRTSTRELQLVLHLAAGLDDSAGNNPGTASFASGARHGDHLYLMDEFSGALRVFDLKEKTLKTVVNQDDIGNYGYICDRELYEDTPCHQVCLNTLQAVYSPYTFDPYFFYPPPPIQVEADGSLVIGAVASVVRVTDPLGPNCRVNTILGDNIRGVQIGSKLTLNQVKDLRLTRGGDYIILDFSEHLLMLVRAP